VVTYATMPWGVGVRVPSCTEVIHIARRPHYVPAICWNPLTWFRKRTMDWDWHTEYHVRLSGKDQEFYEQVML